MRRYQGLRKRLRHFTSPEMNFPKGLSPGLFQIPTFFGFVVMTVSVIPGTCDGIFCGIVDLTGVIFIQLLAHMR